MRTTFIVASSPMPSAGLRQYEIGVRHSETEFSSPELHAISVQVRRTVSKVLAKGNIVFSF